MAFPNLPGDQCRNEISIKDCTNEFQSNQVKAVYRKIINSTLKKRNLNFSDYFETINSYEKRQTKIAGNTIEIMVHPTYNKDGLLIDALDNLEFNHNYLVKK